MDQLREETLISRRERRRREVRRRRLIAGAVLAVLALAAAGVVIGSSGSRGSPSAGAAKGVPRDTGAPGTTRSAPKAVRDGPPGTTPVPILMYHVIAAPPAGAPFPGLYVPPQEFEEQMHALRSAGWHAVTLDQVRAYWLHGTPLGPGRPIVVSFDNGYQSQYTKALPVLRSMGWVGDENIQLSGLPPSQGGLGSDEVRGLIAAGWELDTQGISHADLITLDPQQLAYQVAYARRVLQQRYHVPVNWFCYPSGHYDDAVVDEVRAAGFVGSTTVVPGWAAPGDDPYRLHRLRVLGGTSGAALLQLIDGTRGEGPAPDSYDG